MKKQYLNLAAKAAVSFFIILVLIVKVNLSETFSAVLTAKWNFVIGSWVFMILSTILASYRWRLLIKVQGDDFKMRKLIKLYFIGMFFNLAMPSLVGGDVVRGYSISKYTRSISKSFIPILLERTIGVLALISISLVAANSLLNYPKLVKEWGVFLIFGIIVILLLMISLRKYLYSFVVASLKLIGFKEASGKVQNISDILRQYVRSKRSMSCAFLISLVIQFLVVLANYFIALSMDIEISLYNLCIYIPIINLISMVPISFNGVGIREGAYVYFLGMSNVPESSALSMSIIWLAVLLLCGIIGGIFWIASRGSEKATAKEPKTSGKEYLVYQ